MKKFHFFHLAAVALVALSLLAFGCQQQPKEEIIVSGNLFGKWVDNTKATYEITPTYFKNYGVNYSSYEGDNITIVPLSETSGTIFMKYTVAMNPDWTYTNTAPDVGKWYAVSYKELTDKSIQISGAYKKEGGKTATATLEEAIKEFTIANGYFGLYTPCTK